MSSDSPWPPPFLSSFFGFSAIRASLVRSRVATLAAFWRAVAGHFGGVDDARFHEILELACGCVVAHVAFEFAHLFADHAAVNAGVVGDLREGCSGSRGG